MITRRFQECLEEMKEIGEAQQSIIEDLQEKLRTYDKEEEILKRDKKIESLYNHSLYIMSDEEKDAVAKFRTKHWKDTGCRNGNRYNYELVGSGIGTDITIVCPVCGERKNITDFSNW